MRAPSSTWLVLTAAAGACTAALAGCGTHSPTTIGQIRLKVNSPSTVHTASATISGTVSPSGATVLVLGHTVTLHRGSFTTQVSLVPGTNIIDVLAGGARERDAMSAVRVFRQVYVSVPDLSGDSPDDASQQLHALGLVADVSKDDPFFSFLIPGSDSVCGTEPAAGAKLAPGSTVKVTVSKTC
jgi:hypothetical protein